MAWSNDDVETLKRMWGEGKTATQIADAIPGCAGRSAVIGKANRLGLDARGSPESIGKALHASVVRKLHMRLQRLGLPTGGREAIAEAFAFTETGTPEQISRALGVALAKVESVVVWLEANYGGAPA